MTTKRQILKSDTGKFGKIIAGDKGFKKTLYGVILYVDRSGSVVFVDTMDIVLRFKVDQIDEFTEEEFKDSSK
jgi:hypothetical protein